MSENITANIASANITSDLTSTTFSVNFDSAYTLLVEDAPSLTSISPTTKITFPTGSVANPASGQATISFVGSAVGGFTEGSVIFANASGQLTEDNANLFWDDANNRLGIGTPTPNSKLHVFENGEFLNVIYECSQQNVNIKSISDNDQSFDFRTYTGDSRNMIFGYNAGEDAFVINDATINASDFYFKLSTKYLGLSTGTPDRRLDILDASNPQFRLTHTDNSVFTDFLTNSNGRLAILPSGHVVGIGTDAPYILADSERAINIHTVSGGAAYSGIILSNGSGINSNIKANTSGLYIDSFVGIGATAPEQLLHIQNEGTCESLLERVDTGAFAPAYRFRKARGTVASKTVIASGDSVGQFVFQGWDGTAYRNLGQMRVVADGATGAGDTPGRFDFYTTPDGSISAVVRMTIKNDGKVGINTTTPRRRADFLDASNPQLRLTHTDNSVFTDLQTDASGYLQVTPSGQKTVFNGNVGNTTAEFDRYIDVGAGVSTIAGVRNAGAQGTCFISLVTNADNILRAHTGYGWNIQTNGSSTTSLQVNSTGHVIVSPGAVFGTAATPSLAFGDGDTGFYEDSDDTLILSINATQRIIWNTARMIVGPSAAIEYEISSATNPVFLPQFNDLDTGIGRAAADQLSLIAGGVEIARCVEDTVDQFIVSPGAILGSSALPSLAFGDGDTGFFENIDDGLGLSLAGVLKMFWTTTVFNANVNYGASIALNAVSVSNVSYGISADPDTGMYSPSADILGLVAGGSEGIRITEDTNKLITDFKGATGYKGKEVDTATYTILLTDNTIAVDYTVTGAVTITLPSAANAFNGTEGLRFLIKDSGANAATNNITINRAGADTIIDTATGRTSTVINTNGGAIWIQAKNTTTWMVG